MTIHKKEGDMKRRKLAGIVLISLILILPFKVFCKERLYDESIKPKQYVDILKTQTVSGFCINYDDSDGKFRFWSLETMGPIVFDADLVFIDSMIKIIEKYKEWNIKASAKGIKIDKTISKLWTGKAYWKWGDEWHFSAPIEITFWFLSLTEQKHQLVLAFSKMQSKYNEYLDHRPETLYFDYGEAMKLKNAFSKDKFELFIKKIKKDKMIEDEFK